jgi:hypothetical protein
VPTPQSLIAEIEMERSERKTVRVHHRQGAFCLMLNMDGRRLHCRRRLCALSCRPIVHKNRLVFYAHHIEAFKIEAFKNYA